jgi:hypothetical protein
MADEQPENTPSAEPQSADAPASETSSEAETRSSGAPSWWQRMFNRRPAGGAEEDEAEAEETPQPSEASSKLSLTQEELDRRVQAETDRREAKRAQETRLRQRRELRDSDPWAYAEQDRKDEQAVQGGQQLSQFVGNIGLEHDKVSIDPLFMALPQAEQERIQKLEGAGIGLAGRKLVVQESLKALEKHWKAEGAKDAERRLRSNQAFRKQVLSEMRSSSPEPDLLPSGNGPTEADKTMSNIFRDYYGIGGGAIRRHNNSSG